MKHLLLVDDDPNIREVLGDFLIGSGYEVTCAESGEKALVSMVEHLPDLVILDMGMPGIGGVGFLKRITDRLGRTRVPVLVLTARGDMAEFFADKQIGGFITKPADPDELLEEIRRILFMAADLPRGDTLMVGDDIRKTVIIAEPNAVRSNMLREHLTKAGFSVEAVRTGAEAVEAVIARHPAGLVLPMDSIGLTADIVLEILRKLPAGKSLPAIVYNVGSAYADQWAFIDPRKVTRIDGINAEEIAKAAITAID